MRLSSELDFETYLKTTQNPAHCRGFHEEQALFGPLNSLYASAKNFLLWKTFTEVINNWRYPVVNHNQHKRKNQERHTPTVIFLVL